MIGFYLSQCLLVALGISAVFSYPHHRSYSSRSAPGRIRSSAVPDSLLDYLTNYNGDLYRNQQSQYGVAEYEPSYQQGYVSRRPQISPEAVAAVLSYLSQNDAGDYSYDYTSSPSNPYTDDEGTWYDEAAEPTGYSSNFDNFDQNNQDAAIIQLYLDHLNGKYSLEDLETLEREAALEDNTESQLQAFRPHKKAASKRFSGRIHEAKNTVKFPLRQGQQEEAYMVPATTIRKPLIPQAIKTMQHNKERDSQIVSSTQTSPVLTTQRTPHKSTSIEQKEKSSAKADDGKDNTTMEPLLKSSYDALKKYLNKERRLRQSADEMEHMPQKRFVSDPSSLTQQLANLKKTVS